MPEATDRQSAGNAAEDAALAHLQAHGLQLIQKNARYKVGEIDLVMREGDTIVFVEVRYRASDRFGGGAASVDHRKRRRLLRAASAWLLSRRGAAEPPCRFDVVAVSGAAPRLRFGWTRDAFGAGGG